MSDSLDAFLDEVCALPRWLHRYLALLRELDETSQQRSDDAERRRQKYLALAREKLENQRSRHDGDDTGNENMSRQFLYSDLELQSEIAEADRLGKEARALMREKVAIINQTLRVIRAESENFRISLGRFSDEAVGEGGAQSTRRKNDADSQCKNSERITSRSRDSVRTSRCEYKNSEYNTMRFGGSNRSDCMFQPIPDGSGRGLDRSSANCITPSTNRNANKCTIRVSSNASTSDTRQKKKLRTSGQRRTEIDAVHGVRREPATNDPEQDTGSVTVNRMPSKTNGCSVANAKRPKGVNGAVSAVGDANIIGSLQQGLSSHEYRPLTGFPSQVPPLVSLSGESAEAPVRYFVDSSSTGMDEPVLGVHNYQARSGRSHRATGDRSRHLDSPSVGETPSKPPKSANHKARSHTPPTRCISKNSQQNKKVSVSRSHQTNQPVNCDAISAPLDKDGAELCSSTELAEDQL